MEKSKCHFPESHSLPPDWSLVSILALSSVSLGTHSCHGKLLLFSFYYHYLYNRRTYVPGQACGGQRMTLWSWFSPFSITWVLGITLVLLGRLVWQAFSLLRLLPSPSGHFLHMCPSLPPCFLTSKLETVRSWSPPPLWSHGQGT